ncbi:hypothetical protein SAMN05444280_1363 [Tangfeifania diversioriginum]|uniref:YKOF-related Family n=1 Tax=Tangfeifania diversioriginum TaxID=1168035 RepID=A0A1M6MU57_9BACT|nr:hypothetical protein [Tangfeifania diversioriginum]SHJ86803.1 hypothetical protein SAMN05444280_1363 [Tangfeifania diversioriginum]
MEITVEIGYYPLMKEYEKAVESFLEKLAENKNITLESGTMSSLLTGSYENVMELLNRQLKPFLEEYPSVFILKISSACKTCKT